MFFCPFYYINQLLLFSIMIWQVLCYVTLEEDILKTFIQQTLNQILHYLQQTLDKSSLQYFPLYNLVRHNNIIDIKTQLGLHTFYSLLMHWRNSFIRCLYSFLCIWTISSFIHHKMMQYNIVISSINIIKLWFLIWFD